MINPFEVNKGNKEMVESNINFLLENYFKNSSIKTIIFSWVISNEKIFSNILDRLTYKNFTTYKISLICDPEILIKRMENDGRNRDQIQNSLKRQQNYMKMDTHKIDTTKKDLEDIIREIKEMIY
jgi:hypothetical protein